MAILSAIAFAIGAVVGFAISASVTAAVVYGLYKGVSAIFGAIMKNKMKSTGMANSPTYAEVKQTTSSSETPIALVYGEVQTAGNNKLWQDDESSDPIKRIITFGEGELTSYSDIKINDIPIAELDGITINKYYGTSSQTIDSIVPGSTNADRSKITGSLKNIAYLAITASTSAKVDKSYNLTAVIKGRKIRVYTDVNTYTVVYSNNPAWCLFDLLTCYNGLRMGLNKDGTRDESLTGTILDIQSFITAAAYCDELIGYAKYTTVFNTANSNIFYRCRQANKTDVSIKYTVITGTPSITVTGSKINVNILSTSTANDVISLINSSVEAKKLIQAYNATNSVGTGIVSALSETYLAITEADKKPRYSLNVIFDAKFTARDAIDEIKKVCRGTIVEKNGQIGFKVDKAQDVSLAVRSRHIKKGSEKFSPIPMSEHYDILGLTYISKTNDWSKVEARAELPDILTDTPIIHNQDVYGCTDFEQISRLCWYYLNSKRLCPFVGSFDSDYFVSELEVGDVITIDSEIMNLTDYEVKVLSISDNGLGTYSINWVTYNEDLYTDELGGLEPTALISTLSDLVAYPSNITNFNVVQNQNLLEFSWLKTNDLDTYEIRQGKSWDNASVIGTGLTGESYTTQCATKGILTYWIKAKNKYNYSETATSDLINIIEIPTLNEVINVYPILDGDYTLDSVYVYQEALKLNYTNVWQNMTPNKWEANSYTKSYATKGKWGGAVEQTGNLISKTYDIGAILTSVFSINADFSTFDTAKYNIEIATSNDNITFTDWVTINNGSFTCRYFKIKVTLISNNLTQAVISSLNTQVDVPDRTETYTNRAITDANAGITITYASDTESKLKQPFILATPHVLATPYNTNAYYEVSSSSSTQCVVKLRTNAGVLTTGNVNIQVKGY